LQVERDDAKPELQVDPELGGAAPDRALLLALPESFRERRARVGRMRFVAYERDRAVGVDVADALAGGVSGQPAADDQISGGLHLLARLLRSGPRVAVLDLGEKLAPQLRVVGVADSPDARDR